MGSGPASSRQSIQGVLVMRRALVWAVLGAILFICFTGRGQNPPAGQRPAQGNQPAGASGNPPQQMRGPAPPVQGPSHDPHDLTGVWTAPLGYGEANNDCRKS